MQMQTSCTVLPSRLSLPWSHSHPTPIPGARAGAGAGGGGGGGGGGGRLTSAGGLWGVGAGPVEALQAGTHGGRRVRGEAAGRAR